MNPLPQDIPLTRSDAWILAALILAGGPCGMSALMANADYLSREFPTYDEVSFGVPRLKAACLVEVSMDRADHVVITAAPIAYALPVAPQAIDMMFDLMRLLGCRDYPEAEMGDRSLGRLPGLSAAEVEAAVSERGAWRSRIPPEVLSRMDRVGRGDEIS